MIQDVPEKLVRFPEGVPKPGDAVLYLDASGQTALLPWLPSMHAPTPLVRLGERTLFLGEGVAPEMGSAQKLRQLEDDALRFGAFTALHLARWLREHRYCGRCGGATLLSGSRLTCPACGSELYPVISPAVILGIVHAGKLLVTHYAGRAYRGPALVAGYCEVGETLEQTCRREAMEETGLTLSGSLHYYASQPWGLSGSLLAGFFAETNDPGVTLADGELADALWLAPEALPPPPDKAGALSLTATMIEAFRRGQWH